ncbi:type II toxin-antitoxin system ParD family antitoxin [Methylobacterium sp. J-077]|uniref:type II toxin-antitoxin system ParD family antitoxin n=1 Tax=Methylobacterium sp. J-077 TaxID=2836656 RepID=UPI001FB8AD6C|nr:type II toxin-antitoxin system ParD family antitoxin [Methylobacterium sp. J-077]MCJ2121552.1 type II toxin-antitoxin system ParD family antitoxin [Methylobacterium sp. J-077]
MADIDLSPDLDRFVRTQVAAGHFRDAAEGVAAGLRLLEDRLAVGSFKHRDDVLTSILAAFDDPPPGLPAQVVFDRLEDRHAHRVAAGDKA